MERWPWHLLCSRVSRSKKNSRKNTKNTHDCDSNRIWASFRESQQLKGTHTVAFIYHELKKMDMTGRKRPLIVSLSQLACCSLSRVSYGRNYLPHNFVHRNAHGSTSLGLLIRVIFNELTQVVMDIEQPETDITVYLEMPVIHIVRTADNRGTVRFFLCSRCFLHNMLAKLLISIIRKKS